jgi:hypothetical protein
MITVTESHAISHTQDRRQERLTVTFIPSPPITTNETAIFNCASKPPVAAWLISWWLKDPHTGIERGPTQREEFTSAGIITTGSWTGNSSLIIPGHLTQFNNTLILCCITPQLIALPREIRIAPLIILKVRLVAILFIPSPPITKVGKAIYNCSSSVSSITIQWFMGNNETPTHNNNSLISAGVITNGVATTNSSLIIPGHLTQFNNTLVYCFVFSYRTGSAGRRRALLLIQEKQVNITFIPSPPITTDDAAIFNCSSKGYPACIYWLVWKNDTNRYVVSHLIETSLGVITNGAGESNSSLIIPGHLTQFNNTLVYCFVFSYRTGSAGRRRALLLIQGNVVCVHGIIMID